MLLKNKANLLMLILVFVASIITVFSVPSLAGAEDSSAKTAVCDSLGATGNECSGGGTKINSVIEVVLNILSIVAGVIAVIMMIIAGIKFTTSQGDSGSVASARQTVIYAIVGIVIVAVSQAIVFFVLTEAADLGAPEEDTGYILNVI